MLFQQIPKELNPKLLPIEEISKTDSNMGISSDWTKIVIHIFLGSEKTNLPRVLWVKKAWTLIELHMEIFKHFRDLFVRWFLDYKENNEQKKSSQHPNYKIPGTNEAIDYDKLVDLFEKAPIET